VFLKFAARVLRSGGLGMMALAFAMMIVVVFAIVAPVQLFVGN
jgi:hypothetical protein